MLQKNHVPLQILGEHGKYIYKEINVVREYL
jgi:hypothetical protein